MSLINDALKRAQESRAATNPTRPAGPAMHPVRSHSPSLAPLILLPILLTTLLALAAFLLVKGWQAYQASRTDVPAHTAIETPPMVAAREHQPAAMETAPTASTPSQATTETTATPAATDALVPSASAAGSPAPVAASEPAPRSGPSQAQAQTQSQDPHIASIGNAPPAPVLRLQGIYYRPGQSSVILNGKTFNAGESGYLRLGGDDQLVRVLDIQRTRATIQWQGATQVLTLE